jgi:hypothetical protein
MYDTSKVFAVKYISADGGNHRPQQRGIDCNNNYDDGATRPMNFSLDLNDVLPPVRLPYQPR